MSRDLLEEGPRLEVRFSEDELDGLLEGLNDGGYQRARGGPHQGTGEIRGLHPNGSVVRIFPGAGLCYVYPPGGTSRPTGPIAPFSPLKAACNAANARLPSAQGGDDSDQDGADEAPDADEDAAAAGGDDSDGSGDPSSSPGSGNGDDQ